MKPPIDTKALVTRLKQGDESAFGDLYDAYSGALFGVVSKIVRSEEVGEDVLQDSFIKIWKNIHSFDPQKGTIFTWMLNIARNTAIDKLRKIKNSGKVEIRATDFTVGMFNSYQTTIKVDQIGITDLVNKMSADQKEIIEYIYYNGYTQQEVSDELGIPLGTVKTKVRTAVRDLRKLFTAILSFWI